MFSPPSFSNLKTLSELLKYIETEAREPFGKFFEPLKIKSEPDFPRIDFIDCSPKTYRKASTTLDLPEPFGPTTQTIGLSNSKIVFWAKDLKPLSSKVLRRMLIILPH